MPDHQQKQKYKKAQPSWSFRDKIAVIDGIPIKGKRIIIPLSIHKKVLDQLHISHMGIQKTSLLVFESIYWINVNTDIGNTIQYQPVCLDFQATHQKDKTL